MGLRAMALVALAQLFGVQATDVSVNSRRAVLPDLPRIAELPRVRHRSHRGDSCPNGYCDSCDGTKSKDKFCHRRSCRMFMRFSNGKKVAA